MITNREKIALGRDFVNLICKELRLRPIQFYVNPREWKSAVCELSVGRLMMADCCFGHTIPPPYPHIHVSIRLEPVDFFQVLAHEVLHFWQYYYGPSYPWYSQSQNLPYNDRDDETEAYSFARSYIDGIIEDTEAAENLS